MNRKHIITYRILAFLSFLFISTFLYSQEKSVVYIGINGKLTDNDHAVYMQEVSTKTERISMVQTYIRKDSIWGKICTEEYKKLNDSTYLIKGKGENLPGNMIRNFVQLADKSFKFRDKIKGNIVRSGFSTSVLPLLLDGQITEYYPNGNKKSISVFNNNELVSNENWNKNGDKYIDNIFYSADNEPIFNAGINVMHQHILQGLKDAGIDVSSIVGSIIAGFVVMENGNIDGIKIIKGLGPNINNVVYNSLNTLSLKGNWTPARLNNETVRYFQIFPINFIQEKLLINYVTVRHDDLHYGSNK